MFSSEIRATSRRRRRNSPGLPASLTLAFSLLVTSFQSASASEGSKLFLGTPEELGRALDELSEGGPPQTWLAADEWLPESGVSPADLAPLRRVEELLAAARRSAAELDEEAALRRLVEAQRLAWDSLGVPGAAAFCAEVELQLAVTAAQAGHLELAENSLARAARLDSARQLLAAEASPEVVALARRVFRDAAAGPEAELPVEVSAQGARIFVDDVDRGLAPQRLRLRAGTHALRIEAPGHLAHHARLEVAEGSRPVQRFVLAPDPKLLALASMMRARAGDARALQREATLLLSAASELRAIAWLESGPARERELLLRCDREGCRAPVRMVHGVRGADSDAERAGASLTAANLTQARAWLDAEPAPGLDAALAQSASKAAHSPWWQRWYVWSAVGALAIGGVLTAIALQPEPTRALRVVVDVGDLRVR